MANGEKAIKRAREAKEYFCKLYGVPVSCVVWCGNEKYIIVKNGTEIKIGF